MKKRKKGKKRFEKVISVLFIISVVYIIIFSSFAHYLFNKDFYYREYKKNGTYDVIPENLSRAVTANLFMYFHNQADLQYFSEEEKSHLYDVKVLVGIGYAVFAAMIILLLFCLSYFFKRCYGRGKRHLFDYRGLAETVFQKSRIASVAAFSLVAGIFLLGFLVGFDRLFTFFHQVFFPQGNWEFPSYYPLIVLFPGEFFVEIATRIGLRILMVSLIIYVVSSATFALARGK